MRALATQRRLWLAISLAALIHALGILLAPELVPVVDSEPRVLAAMTSRVENEEPAIPIEFVEVLLPASNPTSTSNPAREISRRSSRRTKYSDPISSISEESDDGQDASPSGRPSLKMRDQAPNLDPRQGSQLNAAIAHAAVPPPASEGRRDLLPGTPTELAKRSPWRSSGNGTLQADGEPFKAKIERDGRIVFRDRPNVQLDGIGMMPGSFVPSLSGRFDLTDAAMAHSGEVLYPHRKLKLMDESREMRAEMARQDQDNSLRNSLRSHRTRLQRLWNRQDVSLARRKRLLFLLWDECAEVGSESVIATAEAIRSITEEFVREHLGKKSPARYTQAELDTLNQHRQSDAPFDPYGPAPQD